MLGGHLQCDSTAYSTATMIIMYFRYQSITKRAVAAAHELAALFMFIFVVKGIRAHGEKAHNNEYQSFHFVRLKSRS